MSVYQPPKIPASEITPKSDYLSRRTFIGGAAAGLAFGGTAASAIAAPLQAKPGPYKIDEKLTPKEAVTTYNNYYEFGVNKSDPAQNAGKFKPTPWTVAVEGLVNKPKMFGLEELLKMPLEDRTYRMRCVEGWSMVIPWIGFPLKALLDQVEPRAAPSMSHSKPSCAPPKCRGRAVSSSRCHGPMWRACGLTKPTTL